MPDICEHLQTLNKLIPAKKHVCDACVPIGGQWVHLRTCQTCGATLCCDSSPHQHASHHARDAEHPVAASAEPGERWVWCYVHAAMAEY